MRGFSPKRTSSYKFNLQFDKNSKMTKSKIFESSYKMTNIKKNKKKKKTCALKKSVFGSGSNNTYRHMNVQ
jgi:hypothetical protein